MIKRSNPLLDQLTCRFGCTDPVDGLFHVPEGCWCWQDPVQALCAQHIYKMESTGPITCLISRQADERRVGP